MVHMPNEGTTYLTVDMPVTKGFANQLRVKLANGDEQEFGISEFQTVLAQNIHELVGLSARSRVLAHLADRYDNLTKDCPFYVAMFYSGLRESEGSLGCIPVETKPTATFGAPVMGLSNPTTKAIPVKISPELEQMLSAQADEAWSPAASDETMRMVSSFWQPVTLPKPETLRDDPGEFMRAECTWAFDNPEHTQLAVNLYQDMAERFNTHQLADPIDDGARLVAFGQYLSVALRWTMKIPNQDGTMSLTTIRNLKRAALETPGFIAILRCNQEKDRIIKARAQVSSDHHFYLCQDTLALVHSHRVKLA